MKKGFLRIVAVIMVVLMTAVYMPVAEISDAFAPKASAASYNGKLGGNVTWSYNSSNKTLVISGSGNMSNYGDTPEDFTKYRALLVTSIYKQATKIEVRNGVTSIGNSVFRNFAKVTTVTIANSVTSIGLSAFEGCTSLSSVTLPSNLKTIGNNAFKNTKFASVTLPDSVTSIGTGAFSGISGLKITCNYGTKAYEYCVNNSISFKIAANKLVLDTSFDADAKQVVVELKMVYNKAKLNAANFTLSYNNAVIPLLTNTVYESENGVAKAVVFGDGKISFAVIAQDYVPYSSNSVCEYDLGSYIFKINGQADKADFTFTCETLMMDEKKASISGVASSEELHVFTEKVTLQPTCKAEGIKVTECSVCGLKTEAPVPVNSANHFAGTKKVGEKAADCGNAGYSGDDVCIDCGVVVFKGTEIKATGNHDYNTVVTPSTCTSEGFTTYTCKVCNHTYTDNKTSVAAHNYKSVVTEPTCTEKGYTTYTCEDCSYTYQGDETPVKAHNYKSIVTDATCTASGYTTYTCEDCSHTYPGDETPVKAHEYEVLVVKEPTCTEGGFTTYKCKNCDNTYNADETAVKAHDYKVIEEVKASCVAEGYTKYECVDCGHTYESEKIPVTAHDYAKAVTEATCTKEGFTVFTCKVCAHTYTGETTPVKAHDYKKETVVMATCVAEGTDKYICQGCGASYTEAVAPTGHEYEEKTYAPTCVDAGYTEYTCMACAASYKDNEVAALGHDFDANGECSRCDETTVVSITFTDSTKYIVDDVNKLVTIRKTANCAELTANIASGAWVVTDEAGNAVAEDKAIVTGSVIKSENGAVVYTVVILGDINKDGKVTSADARVALRVASRIDEISGAAVFAADCDGRENITASDARLILRVGAKLQEF